MRIGYLEPFAGVSGDMLLGAFIHAGVSVEILQEALVALSLGAVLEVQKVDRSGIASTNVKVIVDGKTAEETHRHHGKHSHPKHQTRTLSDILALIKHSHLPDPIKSQAARTFELLGAAEAQIHDVSVESIHFHEVGAVDSIADIVLAAVAACTLEVDAWYCSPLNVGSGTVECTHGRFPVPAPAAAELLRGAPTYSSGIEMELVTPTGAALVRALDCRFEPAPAMRVSAIGYGAGTRNPEKFANVLRLSIGETGEQISAGSSTVVVIETALDDLSPQVIAYVMEQAFAKGALDVICAPVLMKKSRPGTLLTILSERQNVARLEDLLFRETSTLGLRFREEQRSVLDRKHVTVHTEWGEVRVKVASRNHEEFHAAPEFEDCRKIAEQHGIALKLVQESALTSYRAGP